MFNIFDILFISWLIGALMFLAYNLTCVYLFLKEIHILSMIEDNKIMEVLKTVKNELGIRKNVRLYYNDSFSSPVVIGLFKVKIILPRRIYSESDLRNIFNP